MLFTIYGARRAGIRHIAVAYRFLTFRGRQHFHFLLFGTFDTPLAHFRIGGYLSVGEGPMEKEDIDAEKDHGETDEYDSCKQGFHGLLEGEFG
ncbi:MAG TPA: hypothetical protein DCF48_00180 [Rikenellaceae bacterium]|nr:hypothetical protein [Rikenellaceae bacterium]